MPEGAGPERATPDERRVRVVLPIAAGAGVVVGAISMVAGLALTSAALLAVSVLLLGSLALLSLGDGDQGWPVDKQDLSSNDGARREVARLSWAMHGKDSRVEARSARRLHAVAEARLTERGLDLGDPDDEAACRAALGPVAYVALRPDLANPPRFDHFTAALTAVERLHPTPTAGVDTTERPSHDELTS